VATALPLAHHYRLVLAWVAWVATPRRICEPRGWDAQDRGELLLHWNSVILPACEKLWFWERIVGEVLIGERCP